MEIEMDNTSFGTGTANQGNVLKTSVLLDDLETSILLTHKSYFHGNLGNHDNELLYDCVIKYFADAPKISS